MSTTLASKNYKISGELPLTVEAIEDSAVTHLCHWLTDSAAAVSAALNHHGAIRFRGFDVDSPEAFERIARAISPDLKNDYLGTSPRDAVTEYVFHASELPGFFPIPQHCEMSFCAHPPRWLFFCAMTPPAQESGETPLCDFRQVWNDLDPNVRNRFVKRGLKIVRNYAAPDEPAGDSMQLKAWHEMFQSRDKKVVEAKCKAEGFQPEWKADGGLRIWSDSPVSRQHPETGETAWYNHLTTFHVSTPAGEYKRIYRFRPTEQNKLYYELAQSLETDMRTKAPEERSMHTMYADGSDIPDADIEHVRDVVWKHMRINAWQQGDVVAIDNASVAHGRMPYEGPREILVCWS
jgi:alpha-ketoglutarate-dependent taurine dioxygenase